MKYGLIVSAAAVFAFVLMLDSSLMGGDKKKEITIKTVMQKAMKGGLCTKVATGKANDEEKAQLVALFTALSKATPPKGEADSWKEKTEALVAAAKAADGAALKKAADCAGCHSVHKGKKK